MNINPANMQTLSTEVEDRRFLEACLRFARQNQGRTGTNPSVACIIVADTPTGKVIAGAGITALGGRPHAEPPAIEEAGKLAKGATAYVSLEPCAHHGKTPPCAQTLIDCGIARVVIAVTDPDARVNGKGAQMLEEAGVVVDTIECGESATRVLNGYLKARQFNRPFISLKIAMDEKGVMGCNQEGNLRISCAESSAQTHLARARNDAILVGSGTALADNPSLTCRLPGLETQSPIRIVLDAKARLTEETVLISTAITAQTIVVAPMDAPSQWRQMLAQNGVQHMACEMENDRIALPELLDDLGARGIQSILVEGGARLSESLLAEGLVDEIIIHLGGNAEHPRSGECAIIAPFTPDNLPDHFEVCQRLQFGVDTSIRLKRVE